MLKKKIINLLDEYIQKVEICELESYSRRSYSGEPDDVNYDEEEEFEQAKEDLIRDINDHDLGWFFDHIELYNENRLKKSIIEFIENIDFYEFPSMLKGGINE